MRGANVRERAGRIGGSHAHAQAVLEARTQVLIADILTEAPARAVFLDLVRLIDRYAADGVACPS